MEIQTIVLSEELFHAFQHDNKGGYDVGDFNFEFEAKIGSTAIAFEEGLRFFSFDGMGDFQSKVGFGDYGQGSMAITPENVQSKDFLADYNKAANNYSNYNYQNNIGNKHYQTPTTVTPFSLQKMVIEAYEAK